MRLKFTLMTILLTAAFSISGFCQTLPLDFESGDITYTFNDFEGGVVTRIANPQSGGINTSGFVAQMVKNPGAVFAGSLISLASPIDFSTNKIFKVKVFMPKEGAKMLLKVENLTNGAVNAEREVTATSANTWEELTFDFSSINTNEQYQKLVFIFDLGTAGDGSANFTYLFDDIRLVSGQPTVSQMKIPVTFDEANVDYGFIGFGGAENASVVTDPTNENNKVAKVIKSSTAEVWAGVTITAQSPVGFSEAVPFTADKKKLTMRVWSPDANVKVKVKAELVSDATKSVETDAFTTKAGEWETLTFDFANQSAGTAALDLSLAYNKVTVFFNFGVSGAQAGGEKTYYFDDLKMEESVNPPAGPVIPLDFESTAFAYNFTDFEGGVVTRIANPQSGGI
ncbi:MAG: hypothetical protein ACO3FI_04365, partial [Cyclobacteriaceae bacterium]